MSTDFQILPMFPERDYPLLLEWLREYPHFNLVNVNDTVEWLKREMPARIRVGHQFFEVVYVRQPVGFIGYEQTSPSVGVFRGICFSKAVHGTGIPLEAVRMVLARVFKFGMQAVYAEYTHDNLRLERFLGKLGAVDTDFTPDQRERDGRPVAMKLAVIYVDRFHEMHGHEAGQGDSNEFARGVPCPA